MMRSVFVVLCLAAAFDLGNEGGELTPKGVPDALSVAEKFTVLSGDVDANQVRPVPAQFFGLLGWHDRQGTDVARCRDER